jgi:3-deoxy-D-manno-octulosonic-acid transferase
VTTGTLTSAEMLRAALPPRAFHQFVPLDVPRWVERFLDHWRPDAALWMESELWPNMLAALARRGVPSALVNARVSPASFARWQRGFALLRPPLGGFTVVLAQSAADAGRLAALGARDARFLGNLKFDAPQLSADIGELGELGAAIGDRRIWLAASTHPGEEEIVAQAHQAIAARVPGILTLLVPRHAVRGPAIAAMLRARACGSRGAERASRSTHRRRSISPTRWASSACSTGWRRSRSSASRSPARAARIRSRPPHSTRRSSAVHACRTSPRSSPT